MSFGVVDFWGLSRRCSVAGCELGCGDGVAPGVEQFCEPMGPCASGRVCRGAADAPPPAVTASEGLP